MITRDSQLLFDSMVLREDTSEIMNIMGEAIANIALGESRYADAVWRARCSGERSLDIIDDFVASHEELTWIRPRAGLIGFCRLNLDMEAAVVSEKLLQEPYETFVMPGSAYGYPHHIRVGAGGSEAEVVKGLDELDLFFQNLKG